MPRSDERRRVAKEAHKIWVPGDRSGGTGGFDEEAVRETDGKSKSAGGRPTRIGDVIAEKTEPAKT